MHFLGHGEQGIEGRSSDSGNYIPTSTGVGQDVILAEISLFMRVLRVILGGTDFGGSEKCDTEQNRYHPTWIFHEESLPAFGFI